jgi:hypothetical protein
VFVVNRGVNSDFFLFTTFTDRSINGDGGLFTVRYELNYLKCFLKLIPRFKGLMRIITHENDLCGIGNDKNMFVEFIFYCFLYSLFIRSTELSWCFSVLEENVLQ